MSHHAKWRTAVSDPADGAVPGDVVPSGVVPSGAVQSVVNALRVLEAIASTQPVGVSDLARAVALPKSSVQRAARTLHHAGWVRPIGTEQTRWALTSHMLALSLTAYGEYSLRELAQPAMLHVRDQTGETVHLVVLDREHDEGIVLHRVDSTQAVRAFVQVGSRSPLHATASGLAMLSGMPEPDVERVLRRALPAYTRHTTIDPGALRDRIVEVRQRGFAVNQGEWRPEVASISSPIVRSDGTALAAITISIPFSRFSVDQVPDYGALVVAASRGLGAAVPAEFMKPAVDEP
jgi:IclR family acetate operon transcriptional repressor